MRLSRNILARAISKCEWRSTELIAPERGDEHLDYSRHHFRQAFSISKLQISHFARAPRERTRKSEEERLTQSEVSKAPSLRSGSWQPLGATRAFAFLLPSIISQVSAHLVFAPALELLPALRSLETLNCFHAKSPFPLGPRTRSICNCSSSSDNSSPKI